MNSLATFGFISFISSFNCSVDKPRRMALHMIHSTASNISFKLFPTTMDER